MRLPFQIYDFITILFPGILLLMIIRIEYPSLTIWSIDNQFGQITFLFAFAFIAGHLLQEIAKVRIMKRLMSLFRKKNYGENNSSIPVIIGRHYNIPVSKAFFNEFNESFKEFYNIDPSELSKDELFSLIYSPVQDRMGQRNVFSAIANLHRSMASVTVIYLVFLVIKIICIIFLPDIHLLIPETLVLLTVLLISLYLFVNGIDYFKALSDQIPYYAFLSWYKENKMKEKEKEKKSTENEN